ncbi:MAG: CpsB/CapC family capsule biosynthesis tyrosine phosphatase [Deltaproteobacteria bacterium]|nr:CpsB/CapC family capsule biosynthesis tyrosine phosphatase [Deltaproteobacteria bacterium]
MIDLHGHLVYGVDDGPRDRPEALELARALKRAGVTTFACTSHIRPDRGWINDRSVVVANLAKAKDVGDEVGLEVVQGAEHYIDERVFGDDDFADRLVPYGSSRWLLVECPYLGAPPDLLGLLARIKRKGFKILLAHLERFPYACDDDDLVDRLIDAGHLLQVNLGSLAGAYNRQQQKAAERLLKRGRVAVLAGDCHRAPDVDDCIIDGRKAVLKLVTPAVLERLTVTGPQAILDDEPADRVFP